VHYTVCDFLLDLVQNSIEAAANRIQLSIIEEDGQLRLTIEDNGKGMDETTLQRVQDPFFTDGIKHRRRKVGLGIPFVVQAVEQTGGDFTLSSQTGKGTILSFTFPAGHLDTPPLGDLPGLFLSAFCFDGDYELIIRRRNQERELDYSLSRSELHAVLGDFTDAGALVLARQYLESQEA